MSKIAILASFAAVLAVGGFVAGAPARAESVMKECGAEWKTAKANNTTNGQAWKDFLKDCRARHEQASATPGPAPSPTPTVMAAPAPSPTPTPTRTRMSKAATEAPVAGEFANEGEAKSRCPSDTVVWVNTKSHKYHYAGHRSYGTTKKGAYMCEADAKTAGDVAAKGEKPKS